MKRKKDFGQSRSILEPEGLKQLYELEPLIKVKPYLTNQSEVIKVSVAWRPARK
ncbi:hypothetical protein PNK_0057 [Candidatus Protochlamydia naegleriophila]|uniref:Uncharacterized protein n=1 Tax=Candidatus Protochlamydia naegleriophila TaxID=389348 RepID=A0A0U5JBG0_9BACT|nr:hypothetical protein PNK_0057 [Candidatus Protochlamydia naegleriophila]